MKNKIGCSACGACCRMIGFNVALSKAMVRDMPEDPLVEMFQEIIAFPFQTSDGVCEKLVDGKCSVYNTRPDICRSDYLFDKYFAGIATEEEYISQSAVSCNQLIANFNLPEEFLIK